MGSLEYYTKIMLLFQYNVFHPVLKVFYIDRFSKPILHLLKLIYTHNNNSRAKLISRDISIAQVHLINTL